MRQQLQPQEYEIRKIIHNIGEEYGYGSIILNPSGAIVCFKEIKVYSELYLSFMRIDKKTSFLARAPHGVSFDPEDAEEVKKVSILTRNTNKVQRAYISTTTDVNDAGKHRDDKDFAQTYRCFTEPSDDFSFFLLITFNSSDTTGFHFYSNAEYTFPVVFGLKGNPPLCSMADLFTMLFSVFTYDMGKKQKYWEFLREMLERNHEL